jgi:hypothetical protein
VDGPREEREERDDRWGRPVSEKERENARSSGCTRTGRLLGRERAIITAHDWAAHPAGLSEGGKKEESARAAIFVFLFQKSEIVVVFVYFNRIFVELQK